MFTKRTERKTTLIVLGAFLFLATAGLVATASMNHSMQHNCPFTGAVEDCAMVSSGTAKTAVHHISEFKSLLHNTFGSGIVSLITLIVLVAGILFLLGESLRHRLVVFDTLVLSIWKHARPLTFYKMLRWLVLHSRNLVPDSSRAFGYSM